MEEGSIRCDVNVSIRPEGSTELGTRVEMKNINTFSGAVRAIDYEIARQIEVVENGGEIQQETRRWDDVKLKNTVMRTKEDAQDYRYFPDPDLDRRRDLRRVAAPDRERGSGAADHPLRALPQRVRHDCHGGASAV